MHGNQRTTTGKTFINHFLHSKSGRGSSRCTVADGYLGHFVEYGNSAIVVSTFCNCAEIRNIVAETIIFLRCCDTWRDTVR